METHVKILLLISRKVPIQSVYFYLGLVSITCALSYVFGAWAGSNIESAYSFEPIQCLVKYRTGIPEIDNRWDFDGGNTTGNINCKESLKNMNSSNLTVDHVAFSFPFSLDQNIQLEGFTNWIKSLKAFIVFVDKDYDTKLNNPKLDFEAEIVYREEKDPKAKWRFLAASQETRFIHCSSTKPFKGFLYGCTNLPIFQLMTVDHVNYRLNIRFRGNSVGEITYISDVNRLKDVRLVLRHENVKFTQAKVYLKIYFCPFTMLVFVWFFKTHRPLQTLLEKVLFTHSMALAFLNVPTEYIWMWTNSLFFCGLGHLRDIAYQSTLFFVWITFTGYLTRDGKTTSEFSLYRPYLFPLMVWYSITLLNDFERSAVYHDPFYSPWTYSVTRFRQLALYDFIYAALLLAIGFFVIFQFFQIYRRIYIDKSIVLDLNGEKFPAHSVSSIFIVFCSCLFSCVSFTILQFTFDQLVETHWKFHMCDDYMLKVFECPGTFTLFLGVANVLSVAVLLLHIRLHPRNIKIIVARNDSSKFSIYTDIPDIENYTAECCLSSQLEATHNMLPVEKGKNFETQGFDYENEKNMKIQIYENTQEKVEKMLVDMCEMKVEMIDEKKLLRRTSM